MTAWTHDELTKLDTTDELHIASRRRDGSLRRPTIIWMARDGDDLYVRSVRGRASDWFRGVQDQHEGHIQAGGVEKDVTFVDVEGGSALETAIDAAYRSKYHRYAKSIVDSVLSPQARAATVKLVPRS